MSRTAPSVVLAGRQKGYTAQESRQAALRCVERYRESMQQFALMNHLDVGTTTSKWKISRHATWHGRGGCRRLEKRVEQG